MEDYYAILGVQPDASHDDIKRAYRKLAMDLHPDKNPGDATAEERFKQINAAYTELSDPQNRARYDQQRKFGDGQPGGFRQGGFNFSFGFGGNDINDILNQFFNQHGFGNPRPPRNRDYTFTLNLSLEEAFTGKSVPVQFNANGQNHNINVSIPAGVDSGTRIRYAGHGDRTISDAPPGDLYIQVQINEHPIFKRNGQHLHATLVIDALEAMVGCHREFACIDGQKVSVHVPAGTQNGMTLRLKERGMPVRASGHPRGDCLLDLQVQVPKDLTEEHTALLRRILDERRT